MALRLNHGIDVIRKRPTEADFGEVGIPQEATIRVAYRLKPARRSDQISGATEHDGLLHVYRGEDVKDGDIIVLPEGEFTVRGHAQNNYDHPMNGHDFGVVRFDIDGG